MTFGDLVITLLKTPYVHRIYMVLANPMCALYTYSCTHKAHMQHSFAYFVPIHAFATNDSSQALCPFNMLVIVYELLLGEVR
jgi:hypothetical protein